MGYAFGIASLIFSVIAFFIPIFGIMISGVSGFLAWLAIGKGTYLGAAAVIVNLLNICLFSPAYMLAVGVEVSQRSQEENRLFTIWGIVLIIQIAAITIFVINLIIDKISQHIDFTVFKKKKIATSAKRTSSRVNGPMEKPEPALTLEEKSIENTMRSNPSKVTKVLISKIHGGRKRDSKFWSKENDLVPTVDSAISIEPNLYPNSPRRRKSTDKRAVYCVSLIFILIVGTFIGKSAFFTEKDQEFKSPVSIVAAKKQPQIKQNRERTVLSTKVNSHAKIPSISLNGKVFSWEDDEGRKYFSNTNYPVNNPTLRVKREINTYSNITKIRITGGQIYIPVTIVNNGYKKTLNMVLDTGCSVTTVSLKDLKAIRANLGAPTRSTLADGSVIHGQKSRIDKIQVGSKRERNFHINATKVAGSQNTGLLGLNFLKNHEFKIDFDRELLVWM